MAETYDLGASRHLLVSQRLRQRRRTLGLTQKQVVTRLARLGVGTTNKALSSLEHGAGLDVAKLPELAYALDCSVTWLLGLTEDPRAWEPDPRQWEGDARGEAVPPDQGAPAARSFPGTPAVGTDARQPWILGPLQRER
jgi:transcriptional regulator with XRE-family HTH domain